MECTPKCRLTKHADLVLSAITKEDAASIRAILPRICSNFARVSDQFGRNALHLAASCGKGDILEWLVKEFTDGIIHGDTNPTKAVSYDMLNIYLLRAVQQLADRVAALEAR